MKTEITAFAAALLIALAGSCSAETFSTNLVAKESRGRKLKQYDGCSSGAWGSVCTTDYKNGTSSTCTTTPYYSGCSYYPTGGRKLLAAIEGPLPISYGRQLKAYEGCSSGSWGSVCTTDNKDGTSTICTKTPYYDGCSTYPNGEAGKK